jgi:hypothetical protein
MAEGEEAGVFTVAADSTVEGTPVEGRAWAESVCTAAPGMQGWEEVPRWPTILGHAILAELEGVLHLLTDGVLQRLQVEAGVGAGQCMQRLPMGTGTLSELLTAQLDRWPFQTRDRWRGRRLAILPGTGEPGITAGVTP